MNSKSISLSSDGIKNIITGEETFVFQFGKCQVSMDKMMAEFISPIVSQMHHSDKTIDSIQFEFPENIEFFKFEEICTNEIFSFLRQIFIGSSISINEEQSVSSKIIAVLLGNEELFNKLNDIYPLEFNFLNIESYLQYVTKFYYLSYICENFDFSRFVEKISQNFYLIDQNKLVSLPKSILYTIISNEKLKLNSEDSLFEFINKIFENDNPNDAIPFYELIQIPNLTDECFIQFLLKIDANDINSTIWQNIRKRFCVANETTIHKSSSLRYGSVFYDGDESNSFHGIINKLTQENGGNVVDKGIVSVSSSTTTTSGHCKNVTELNNLESIFRSQNLINQWIKYDFKNKKVHPTHYSIRSCPSNWTGYDPDNWIIEGSNDDINWRQLDSQSGVNCLCGESAFKTFKIKENHEPNEFYRFIRMRMTKQHRSRQYLLTLSALEFFGIIVENGQ